MLRRVVLFFSGGLFIVMNLLLWRHEISGPNLGSRIDPSIVFRKIIEAPDESSLQVYHRKTKFGYCTWRPKVDEGVRDGLGFSPDGIVEERLGYSLDVDGRLSPKGLDGQLKIAAHVGLDTSFEVQAASLNMGLRGSFLEIWTSTANTDLNVTFSQGDSDRSFSFPISKVGDVANAVPALAGLNFGPAELLSGFIAEYGEDAEDSVGVEAWSGWMDLGHARMRVYRLVFMFWERYEATVTVSRVGEILEVRLPNDILVVNEILNVRGSDD